MFVWLNVLGFSIGLAVFMIITLFVYNEFSVDTKYPEHEQLYRQADRFRLFKTQPSPNQ